MKPNYIERIQAQLNVVEAQLAVTASIPVKAGLMAQRRELMAILAYHGHKVYEQPC